MFIFTKLLLREIESSVVVELNLLVLVVAAVLITSQCLLWYKNKLPFFLLSLKTGNSPNYSLQYFKGLGKEGEIDNWHHLGVLNSVIKVRVVKTALTVDILVPQLSNS